MKNFKKQALSLIKNGYVIVPINQGTKAPFVEGWQFKDFNADDVNFGVGIKTGQGSHTLYAVDVDIPHDDFSADMVEAVENIAGATIQRIGKAPKTLLVYRTEESMTKQSTAVCFNKDGVKAQVEFLGKGQQFVAYSEHPDTNADYEWVDFFGGAEAVAAKDLTVISQNQVEAIIAKFDELAVEYGFAPKTKAKTATGKNTIDADDFTVGTAVGMTADEAKAILDKLDASYYDEYDEWVKTGMALHSEFGDDGFELWDGFSQKSDKYTSSDELQAKWDSFGNHGSKVTMRTLIQVVKDVEKRERSNALKSVVHSYQEKLNACDDIFELEVLIKEIGTQLEKSDIALIDKVQKMVRNRWAEIEGKYPDKLMINKMLNIKETIGFEDLQSEVAFTEFGNADRFVKEHGDNVKFIVETEQWLKWNGSKWVKAGASEIESLCQRTLVGLVSDLTASGNNSKQVFEFVAKSFTAKMLGNVVRIAKASEQIQLNFSQLDSNKKLLGVNNGVIDLTTGKHYAPDPDDLITIASSVDYVAGADCPVWKSTLHDVFGGDADMLTFFQKLCGYIASGEPHESKIVIPFGEGANGKSTVFNTLREVLGEHSKTASAETFAGNGMQNSGSPREDILRLAGSRFVYVGELDENAVLKEGLIKSMTGGEPMIARAMYGKTTVEIIPSWTVVMPTNHKPIIKGTDHAIWRRLVMIPFLTNFDDPKFVKDVYRSEKLKAEYSGILNWIIEGVMMFRKDNSRLILPRKVLDANKTYREESDLLANWLEDCCVVGEDEKASINALWVSWLSYAEALGEAKYISSARSLAKRLENRFERYRNMHGRGFIGVGIKADSDNDLSVNAEATKMGF